MREYIKQQRELIGYENHIEVLGPKFNEEVRELYKEEIISEIKGKASPNLANEIADVLIVGYSILESCREDKVITNPQLSVLVYDVITNTKQLATKYSVDYEKACALSDQDVL